MTKYRAKPVTIDGVRFDSGVEGKRYLQLKALQAAGRITDLVCHPKWQFHVADVRVGSFSADFGYTEEGVFVIEDVKAAPTRTEAYRIRVKLLKALYGLDVIEVDKRGARKVAFTLPKSPKRARA